MRAALADAGADRTFHVASNPDVQFEDGFSGITYDPPEDFHNHAFRWVGQNGHVHLRTHGDKAMHLIASGWINEKVIRSRPVVSAYLDGFFLGTSIPDDEGHWMVDTVVPSKFLRRSWVDLSIRTSAVAFHWAEPPELKVVVLYGFSWFEAT